MPSASLTPLARAASTDAPRLPVEKKTGRPTFDSPCQEAFLSLWRTYDRLRIMEDALFEPHDLTAQQYNAMRLLRWAHPRTVPTLTLASRLVSRSPDITRLLDRLEQRGLVRRDRLASNRRVVQVGLAPAGLALLDKLAPLVRESHERQLGHLSAPQRKTLVELLRIVRQPHESADSQWK